MEAVVERDDEALIMQDQILLEHNLGLDVPEPAIVIDLNALASLDGGSTEDSAANSEVNGSACAACASSTSPPPPPQINFSVEEIQTNELMTDAQLQELENNASLLMPLLVRSMSCRLA
jgi:hypothetical protein